MEEKHKRSYTTELNKVKDQFRENLFNQDNKPQILDKSYYKNLTKNSNRERKRATLKSLPDTSDQEILSADNSQKVSQKGSRKNSNNNDFEQLDKKINSLSEINDTEESSDSIDYENKQENNQVTPNIIKENNLSLNKNKKVNDNPKIIIKSSKNFKINTFGSTTPSQKSIQNNLPYFKSCRSINNNTADQDDKKNEFPKISDFVPTKPVIKSSFGYLNTNHNLKLANQDNGEKKNKFADFYISVIRDNKVKNKKDIIAKEFDHSHNTPQPKNFRSNRRLKNMSQSGIDSFKKNDVKITNFEVKLVKKEKDVKKQIQYNLTNVIKKVKSTQNPTINANEDPFTSNHLIKQKSNNLGSYVSIDENDMKRPLTKFDLVDLRQSVTQESNQTKPKSQKMKPEIKQHSSLNSMCGHDEFIQSMKNISSLANIDINNRVARSMEKTVQFQFNNKQALQNNSQKKNNPVEKNNHKIEWNLAAKKRYPGMVEPFLKLPGIPSSNYLEKNKIDTSPSNREFMIKNSFKLLPLEEQGNFTKSLMFIKMPATEKDLTNQFDTTKSHKLGNFAKSMRNISKDIDNKQMDNRQSLGNISISKNHN